MPDAQPRHFYAWGCFPEISCIHSGDEDKRRTSPTSNNQSDLKGSHRGAAEKEMTVAISKDTPKQTEARFKKEERSRDGAEAMLEYEAEGRAVREKTARLKALRLGKKDAGVKAAAKQANGAVKKAASKVTGAPAHP
jgi:hypothetical protein